MAEFYPHILILLALSGLTPVAVIFIMRKLYLINYAVCK
ncbi:hypothetical protein RNAN_1491 [Rheinheimera nanhaiensis E407-8]|uniref:Uncharacterized protein n=1 Tax=Rheinheimera nanhaiensis E407-8 TaxID=562729 RepID=I1DWU0_9GAMM|nr:hypothetical protein RNAN_1491 [Rheinheimera nanhaiensis E407-8]